MWSHTDTAPNINTKTKIDPANYGLNNNTGFPRLLLSSMDEAIFPEISDAENTDVQLQPDIEPQEREGLFFPPLYVQRYSFVHDVLSKHHVKSVVDFGSAECKIVPHLKNVTDVEKIALVDLDRTLLEEKRHSIKPKLYDFVDKRENPLTIQIFHGNATQIDQRLVGYEAATLVEIVEHLYLTDLEGVKNMVFGLLKPRVVVITTPNSEYNVLFPNFTGMRHADHKFEWTREEFSDWCDDIAMNYGYSVEYSGIGDPPPSACHVGHCSQAAIFIRDVQYQSQPGVEVHLNYEMIAEAVYPQKEASQLPLDTQLQLELQYVIRLFTHDYKYRDEDDNIVIPICKLHSFQKIKSLCNLDQLRSHLKKKDHQFSQDQDSIIVIPEGSTSSDHSDLGSGNESGQFSDAEDDHTFPVYEALNVVSDSTECWDQDFFPP